MADHTNQLESNYSLGGSFDGVGVDSEDFLNHDKDEVFAKLDNLGYSEEIEFIGKLSKGDLEGANADQSIDWGNQEKFWDENNYSSNGWRAYFSPSQRELFFYVNEHYDQRVKGNENQKDEAEEEQVEYEKRNYGEDLGDTKGAEGGYLGRAA